MGIYLNPDNYNFKESVRGDIYVDKTMMISVTNDFIDKGNKYVCMSRPRRFGKTIAGNMLSAYYSKGCDSRGLFAPYKIAEDPSFEGKLNKYNVIKIDMNSEYQNIMSKDRLIHSLTEDIKDEMRSSFTDIDFSDDDSLAKCILKIYSKKDEKFVIIIDEYDVLVREQVSEGLFNEYLSFLNGLFKSDTLRPAISLAYLTGILPVVRDRIQSKLNNFEEYTIMDAGELAEYVGFTCEEVKDICNNQGLGFEECRRWYDGYYQRGFEIYNPESVIKASKKKEFDNYWGKTSTYAVITDQLKRDFEGIREDVVRLISGESIKVDTGMYLNTMTEFNSKDDVFAYLIHTGYLAYDHRDKTCRIPNWEIRNEWRRAVSVMGDYASTNRIITDSEKLLEETLKGNAEAVSEALDVSHIHVTSIRSYNNEYALQSAIYLAYIYALNKYTVFREVTAGKGFADMVYIPFVPDFPALIIELKRNDSADSAIDQIQRKEYFRSLDNYSGEILFVGINYDEKKKKHTCNIERFEK